MAGGAGAPAGLPRPRAPLGGSAVRVHNGGMDEFLLRPDPSDPRLTRRVTGIDHQGKPIETSVVVDKTLYCQSRLEQNGEREDG